MDRGQLRAAVARLLLALALALGVGLGLSSCRLIFTDTGPLEVVQTGTSFTLSWDSSQESSLPDTPSAVSHYELYYRVLGGRDWHRLGTTSGPEPVYTVRWPALFYGEFELAVRSVRNDGLVSEMHTSTDYDAWPTGGWYLNWKP